MTFEGAIKELDGYVAWLAKKGKISQDRLEKLVDVMKSLIAVKSDMELQETEQHVVINRLEKRAEKLALVLRTTGITMEGIVELEQVPDIFLEKWIEIAKSSRRNIFLNGPVQYDFMVASSRCIRQLVAYDADNLETYRRLIRSGEKKPFCDLARATRRYSEHLEKYFDMLDKEPNFEFKNIADELYVFHLNRMNLFNE